MTGCEGDDDPYLIPGTGVLRNKLGLRDAAAHDRAMTAQSRTAQARTAQAHTAQARDEAAALARGAARVFAELGYAPLTEFTLPDGRRADVAGLGPKGEFAIAEVKSGLDDLRADEKWPDYLAWCDRFYFAVSARFPQDAIPDDTGIIVADAFGGAVVRAAPESRLAPARRKALTLRFARAAADRLARAAGLAGSGFE